MLEIGLSPFWCLAYTPCAVPIERVRAVLNHPHMCEKTPDETEEQGLPDHVNDPRIDRLLQSTYQHADFSGDGSSGGTHPP